MEVRMRCRGDMRASDWSDWARGRLGRLDRYGMKITSAEVALRRERHSAVAEVILHAKGSTLRSEARSPEPASAIDAACRKVEHQLQRYRDRRRSHDIGLEVLPPEAPPARPDVSVVRRFDIRPMFVSEALEHLDRTGYNFWIFLQKPSARLALVYRRADGTYGLMELHTVPSAQAAAETR